MNSRNNAITNPFRLQTLPNLFLQFPVLLSLQVTSGTGFLYVHDNKIFLVTAKHVLVDDGGNVRNNNLIITCPSIGNNNTYKDTPNAIITVDFQIKGPVLSREYDIAIVLLGNVIQRVDQDTLEMKPIDGCEIDSKNENGPVVAGEANMMFLNSVAISNDVYLGAYPSSIGLQSTPQLDRHLPLIRKGIVANINTRNKTLVLDCSVYPGNSGAPIFQLKGPVTDSYKIIGVVSRFVPYVQEWRNSRDQLTHTEYHNSGYSIVTAMDAVIELIDSNFK